MGMGTTLVLTSGLHAKQKCAVEVKLLLSADQTATAIASLKMGKESAGEVYFFDTDSLDLLSKGAIVRLRRGSQNDLTVKVRSPSNQKISDPTLQGDNFKCEVDMNGGQGSVSYSIQTTYGSSILPDTGQTVLSQLNEGQKELLKEARVAVDWTRVKRIAGIKSTDWDTRGLAQFDKLTLELWEWSEGKVLELSTKVGPDDGSSAHARLTHLVNDSGLSLSAIQRPKTNMVLEKIANHSEP
jgi:hypothetical protein